MYILREKQTMIIRLKFDGYYTEENLPVEDRKYSRIYAIYAGTIYENEQTRKEECNLRKLLLSGSLQLPREIKTIGVSAFEKNQLTGTLEIPPSVTEIGAMAFSGNQLSGVNFSADVAAIPAMAFSDNQLTALSISPSVAVIGERAFAFNQLSAVVIPDHVREIKKNAFGDNPVTIIAIGNNVTLHRTSFDNGFAAFYNRNGKKAGAYIFAKGAWSVR
jgi:hypothetical protein